MSWKEKFLLKDKEILGITIRILSVRKVDVQMRFFSV